MKVLILTSETPANIWLVNTLMAQQEVVGIVVERPPLAAGAEEKLRRRRALVRRHGLLRTVNKLLYNKWAAAAVRGDPQAALQEFFPGGAAAAYGRDVPTLCVRSINDPQCIEFVRAHAPDVLAVCGTNVIKEAVFTLAPRGAVNIHTGITPEYRSADPVFWALYCGEPQNVGVTIHYVDRGIDTGPVIYQERVAVYRDDTLASIARRCVRQGAALYGRALQDIAGGTVRTRERPGVRGRSFRSIDLGILQYWLFRLRFARLRRTLPAAPPSERGGGEHGH